MNSSGATREYSGSPAKVIQSAITTMCSAIWRAEASPYRREIHRDLGAGLNSRGVALIRVQMQPEPAVPVLARAPRAPAALSVPHFQSPNIDCHRMLLPDAEGFCITADSPAVALSVRSMFASVVSLQ